MVDVEHKSLMFVKKNVRFINELLSDLAIVKEKVFGECTYINKWNPFIREKLYKSLAIDILNKGLADEWASALAGVWMINTKDLDINMFLSVLTDFKVFFDKVYEVYLLDQLLFILNNLSETEIEQDDFSKGFRTWSFFEESNFNLHFSQVTLDNIYREEGYKTLLNVEAVISSEIRKILRQEKIQGRLAILKCRLESLYFSKRDCGIYVAKLYMLIMESFSFKATSHKNRSMFKDDMQLTLFLDK